MGKTPRGRGRKAAPGASSAPAPGSPDGPDAAVPIPCRSCDLGRIPYPAKAGAHALLCPRCGKATLVDVFLRGGRWFVRTREAV